MTEVLLGVILVALCAHRAARAITTDTITDRPRSWVYERAFRHEPRPPMKTFIGDWNQRAEAEAGIIPPPEERVAPEAQTISKLWAYGYGLLSCPHCCGWWLSIALWAVWVNVDDLRIWIAAGSVAGLQSVISAKGMA